jgi:tetratricopeptide (TPR) repeat protein
MKYLRPIISLIICTVLVAPVKPSQADRWTSVRTRNLFLISNASPEQLRSVAAWLELFNDAFTTLVSKPVFSSGTRTVGIIFRSDQDFTPFKPQYQGKPADVAGYFQPGEDVNYIALSLERGSRDPLNAAFHEYVHLYVRDNLPQAPLWLNEGLAEFYSTFELSAGEPIVGKPIQSYLALLRNSELLPLSELFTVNNASAHYNERDKRGIFYAESWALVHYLMLADNGERKSQLSRFLGLLAAGGSAENSFNMAFQTSLPAMERELSDHVRRNSFPSQRASLGRGGYGATEVQALSEAEADCYLGDLLLHLGREADAEKYFVQALSLDPNLVAAHAALGMLRVRQGRIAEAGRHLQRAVSHSDNHLVHFYYAYALSRQGMDNSGRVETYSAELIRLMRSHLNTSIKLNPNFMESYHLLAFVNLVANEQLEQSVDLVKRGLALEPQRQDLKLTLAQIYLKQGNEEAARRILESLARQSDDKPLQMHAQALLNNERVTPATAPQFSTAGASKVVSVSGVSGTGDFGGMRIDTSNLPSVDEVLAKYVAAVGGAEKIQSVKSRVTRGSVRVPGQFQDAAYELYEKLPNKVGLIIKAPSGTFSQAFDGSDGWRRTPGSPAVKVKGSELAEFKRDSDLYAPLRLKSVYAAIKLLGRVKIGYREAYLVEATSATGAADKFYFETSSGLLIRFDGERTSWRGRARFEVYYDEWKDVEGVMVPFRVTRSSPHFSISFSVNEVKNNVVVDDAIFTVR